MNVDNVVMELIVKSGLAKSQALEALAHARCGEYDKAEKSLADSREAGRLAHKMQTALIAADNGEGKVPVNLLLVHAQDHLMNSMLAQDMVEEMIRLYQRLDNQ
ncbi:PTS lactose/cellobiose transporter subunit IIA [Endozoicomonas sp. SCSIO W0465]|uniref:PTS lactose/cellobiose transporter subunit IIA n=1 Tax=Endozoicomonas sp. SCSIO W0465 TaxID=2918516 RepID=UPI00207511D8|nr:PTS lactose/cellobiose transporter subunit IIA [Endozoicomonas sp. SCSIO W0465]USE38207.1 PTS lactose/cellobiose transporter subunit IIA [Endozoicomonas sp. SCSIO W0465]